MNVNMNILCTLDSLFVGLCVYLVPGVGVLIVELGHLQGGAGQPQEPQAHQDTPN